jgi:hypothetical protein
MSRLPIEHPTDAPSGGALAHDYPRPGFEHSQLLMAISPVLTAFEINNASNLKRVSSCENLSKFFEV